MPRSARPQPPSREELKEKLLIDDDDLDSGLVEQPSLFFAAAEAASLATSQRDTVKLELKELKAELDQDIRRNALNQDPPEKLTETQLSNRITLLPRVKDMERRLLAFNRTADDSTALKESFVQRSYALKDLTARQNSQMATLAIERGSDGARRDAGTRAREREIASRREQDRAVTPRYRSRDTGE
jgi:hypothetical protein